MTAALVPAPVEVLPSFTLRWGDDGCRLALRGAITHHTLEQVDALLDDRWQQLRRLTVDTRSAHLTRGVLRRLIGTLGQLPGADTQVELFGITESAVEAVALS